MAYGKTNVEQFKNEEATQKKQREEQFKRDPRFFYSENKQPVDLVFCPPYSEQLTAPHHGYKVHYKLGRLVYCLQSWGEPCPACDVARDMYKRGQSGDKKAMDLNIAVYARESYFYNVIPFIGMAPVTTPLSPGVMHVATFAPPKADILPAIQIYRCGKKAHKMVRDFLQFNGDIFDPMSCNVINLSYVKQASKAGGSEGDYDSPLLNIRPQKCQLHSGFLKMLERAGTKVEDQCMYDLKAVLAEFKPTREEVKALIDAKVAEWFATPTTQSVAVPAMPAFGGGPVAAIPVPPVTSVTVTAPPSTGAVPTMTPAMVTPPVAPAVPQAPISDPLSAFAKGL